MLNEQRRVEELSAHGLPSKSNLSNLSYGELIQTLSKNLLTLLKLETALVRSEVRGEIAGEILVTRRLIIGAGLIVVGATMFLVGICFAATSLLPPWMSSFLLAVIIMGAGITTIILVWKRHHDLARVGVDLKEKLLWKAK